MSDPKDPKDRQNGGAWPERGPDTPIEMTSLPVDADALSTNPSTAAIFVHVIEQLAQAQRTLLSVKSLSSLAKYLLEDFPGSFGSPRAELILHDPQGNLASLLPIRKLFGEALSLQDDSQALYRLYANHPEAELVSLDDRRMFHILPGTTQAAGAVLMPLVDGNRLIGSYHLALTEEMARYDERERDLFAMLGGLVASALLRVVEFQQVDQLALIDPVTEVGNQRAFRRNMQREILWARRVEQPVGLLVLAIDDLDNLARTYGEVACQFVQRRVSQRLCSCLRGTDYIAHVSPGHFTVLLPNCSELHAHDIAERLRLEMQEFAIDDGQGAILHITLSTGLVAWDPRVLPIESTEHLAQQMESESEAALHRALREGGNTVSVARLGILMV